MTTPSPTTPEMVEKVARAIHDACEIADGCPLRLYDTYARVDAECQAEAAIAAHTQALEEAGIALVPLKPTEAMVKAGIMAMDGHEAPTATTAVIYGQPKDIWQAMVNEARK